MKKEKFKYQSKLDRLVKTDEYGNEETATTRIQELDKKPKIKGNLKKLNRSGERTEQKLTKSDPMFTAKKNFLVQDIVNQLLPYKPKTQKAKKNFRFADSSLVTPQKPLPFNLDKWLDIIHPNWFETEYDQPMTGDDITRKNLILKNRKKVAEGIQTLLHLRRI